MSRELEKAAKIALDSLEKAPIKSIMQRRAMNLLREALDPEPTQDEEPVAIVRFDDNDLAEIEWWDYARVTEGRHYLYFVPIPLTDEEIENEVRRMAGIYLDTMCEAIDRTTDKKLADLHPAPRPEFVRLSEEDKRKLHEEFGLWTSSIRAVEDALEEKNTINRSDPDSVDLQSRCRGDKL